MAGSRGNFVHCSLNGAVLAERQIGSGRRKGVLHGSAHAKGRLDGMGRMGYPMAAAAQGRLRRLRSGIAPAPRRAARQDRRQIVDKLSDLSAWTWCSPSSPKAGCRQVYLGKTAWLSGNKAPGVFVDCSTISVEESADIRKRLSERGADFRLRAGQRQRQGHRAHHALSGTPGKAWRRHAHLLP